MAISDLPDFEIPESWVKNRVPLRTLGVEDVERVFFRGIPTLHLCGDGIFWGGGGGTQLINIL